MKQIINVIKKDLREIYRQTLTFRLVFLSPFILILILGVSLRGEEFKINFPLEVGLCNLDDEFPQDLVDILEEEEFVNLENLYQVNCENLLFDKISEGEYKAGILIPHNFSNQIAQGNQVEITLYLDNSIVGIGNIVKSYFWQSVQKYSEKVESEAAESLRLSLREMSNELEGIQSSLNFSEDLQPVQNKVTELTTEFYNIDAEELENKLNQSETELYDADHQLQKTYDEMTDTQIAIRNQIKGLGKIKRDLENYSVQVVGLRGSLYQMYEECEPKNSSYCQDTYSAYLQLGELNNGLQQKMNESDSTIHTLKEINTSLEQKKQEIAQLRGDMKILREDIANTRLKMTKFEELQSKLNEFNGNFTSFFQTTQQEEESLKDKMAESQSKITEMTFVSMPVKQVEMKTYNVFAGKTIFDFVFPAILSFIIMFFSVLLSSTAIVTERITGTLKRNLIAPMRMSSFLTGKILTIVLINIFIATIILLVSKFLFNLYFTGSLMHYILEVVLASIAFISIGSLIGIFSNSSSTSMLFSITFMVPLIFLSGVIIPSEFLPTYVISAERYLPLYQSVEFFKQLFIYNQFNIPAIFYFSVFSAILFLVVGIAMRREIY